MNEIVVDTGPLVAYLDRSDRDHAWAKECFMKIPKVMTLDSDFVVYRKSRRKVIPLLRPER